MVDLRFDNHGSIITITPLTERAEQWVADNVQSDPWQWMGKALCVDRRFAFEICQGALEEGFVCE